MLLLSSSAVNQVILITSRDAKDRSDLFLPFVHFMGPFIPWLLLLINYYIPKSFLILLGTYIKYIVYLYQKIITFLINVMFQTTNQTT